MSMSSPVSVKEDLVSNQRQVGKCFFRVQHRSFTLHVMAGHTAVIRATKRRSAFIDLTGF